MKRVPLIDQLEELEQEWERRGREYPELVARGRMRPYRMEAKMARLEAAIRTMEWLNEHQDALREYVIYATRIAPPAQGGQWNERVPDGPCGQAQEAAPPLEAVDITA
jgi:hypothetical protein